MQYRTTLTTSLFPFLAAALVLAGCSGEGGADEASARPASDAPAELSRPAWMSVVEPRDRYPRQFNGVDPVFEGAVSEAPTSLNGATQPGASETISFTASERGDYVITCYVPGHANGGHRIRFRVSGAGRAGIREL